MPLSIPEEATAISSEGFIRLVDSMGDDMSVVKSARVSYGKESKGKEADQKLINFLMQHNHGTPFEHIVFTFHVRCPLFVARQWFRHRIGSFNEISGRYTTVKTDFWVPDSWRVNNTANHQASSEGDFSERDTTDLLKIYHDALDTCEIAYNALIEQGVAREQARAILPMATYTEFYWSVNARSLFNFLKLRSAKGAQKEIRDYAEAILVIVKTIAPWTFEAFQNQIRGEQNA